MGRPLTRCVLRPLLLSQALLGCSAVHQPRRWGKGAWTKFTYDPTAFSLQPLDLHVHGAEGGFVGSRSLSFGWRLGCDGCVGVKQEALRIHVEGPEGAVLDTGKLNIPQLRYAVDERQLGALASDTRYTWRLTVWANAIAGGVAQNLSGSEHGGFQTALLGLENEDWRGSEWISGGTSYRGELSLDKGKHVAAATAYISGTGCYELSINGQDVHPETYMEPSWTNIPNIHMHYRAYDALPHLSGRSVVVGVRTGMCMFGYLGAFCQGANGGYTGQCRGIILRLSVRYSDNTTQNLSTSSQDGNWFTTVESDPVEYSHLYHGEIYDSRKLEPDWNKAGFNRSSAWRPAVAYPNAKLQLGDLVLAQHPPITISESRQPVKVTDVKIRGKKFFIYDFGQNMAGFVTMHLDSVVRRGTEIFLTYGEVLHRGNGTLDLRLCEGQSGRACKCLGGNCANQTDMYITSGEKKETFTPHFTYHGYRYVQVGGVQNAPRLVGHFVHTNVTERGRVRFDRPRLQILNKIQTAVRYTLLSNMHHIPEDCPHREKRGWLADAQIASAGASLNFDTTSFYGDWLRTFTDSQVVGCTAPGETKPTNSLIQSKRPSTYQCCNALQPSFGCNFHGVSDNLTMIQGSLPDVVPYSLKPYGGWPGDPSWSSAGTVIPRVLLAHSGGPVLPEHYAIAKGVVDFLDNHGDPKAGNLASFGFYGDWFSIEDIPPRQVAGFSHVLSVQNARDLAEALGKAEDAKKWSSHLEKLKAGYHQTYFRPESSSYGKSQTANLLPLYLDITPPELVPNVTETLLSSIRNKKDQIKAGFIGAAYFLQTLVKVGHGEMALKIANRTSKPSWGFMVEHGPGTIWESWGDDTDSFNHPAFTASISSYLYSLAGIKSEENLNTSSVRRVTFELDQKTMQMVGAASVSLVGPAGPATFSWAALQDEFTLNISVPHGEEADVLVPRLPQKDGECLHLQIDGTAMWTNCLEERRMMRGEPKMKRGESNHVAAVEMVRAGTLLKLVMGSGQYTVQLTSAPPGGRRKARRQKRLVRRARQHDNTLRG